MHSRCCWPPESAPPGVAEPVAAPRSTGRRGAGTARRARPCRCRGRPLPRQLAGPATTFSAIVIAGNGFGFWNTMPMRRRTSVAQQARPVDVVAVEETSPASAAPGTSSCIRLRIRRNVDLPQPDGPMSAVTCPAGISSVDALEHLVVAEPGADVARDQLGACRSRSAAARGPRWSVERRSVSGCGSCESLSRQAKALDAADVPGPATADDARDEEQHEHDHQQHERAGPGAVDLRAAAGTRMSR